MGFHRLEACLHRKLLLLGLLALIALCSLATITHRKGVVTLGGGRRARLKHSSGALRRLRGGSVYSSVLSQNAHPGESRIHVCSHATDCAKSEDGTVTQPFDDRNLTSLWDIFQSGLSKNPDGPCFEARGRPGGPFSSMSYREVEIEALTIAKRLKAMGVRKGSRVGIFARNMPRWSVAQLACASQGFVVTPIYETIGANAMTYISSENKSMQNIFEKPAANCVL